MKSPIVRRIALVIVTMAAVSGTRIVIAADSGIGTWVRVIDPKTKAIPGQGLTMTVEAWGGSGRRLTYRAKDSKGATIVLTVENEISSTEDGHRPGKATEAWIRK